MPVSPLAAWLALSFLIGCSGSDEATCPTGTSTPSDSTTPSTSTPSTTSCPTPTGTTSTTPEGQVGSAGGVVEVDGVIVDIPAGALGADRAVEVVSHASPEAAGATPAPDYVDAVGGTVVLTPHGTRFLEPVTVTLPYDTSVLTDPDEIVLLRLDDETDPTWEAIGGFTVADGVITFQTTTFSVITAAQVAQGACPCWTGKDIAHFEAAVTSLQGAPLYNQQAPWGWHLAYEPLSWSEAYMTVLNAGPTCKWFGPTADWATYFSSPNAAPLIPHGTASWAQLAVTGSESEACRVLATRAQTATTATNLGVTVTGLAAGEVVTLTDDAGTTTLDVDLDGALTWFPTAYGEGERWEVAVVTPPADKECTVKTREGLFARDNVLVEVTCQPSAAASGCDLCGDDLSGTWNVVLDEWEYPAGWSTFPLGPVELVPTVGGFPQDWTASTQTTLYDIVKGNGTIGYVSFDGVELEGLQELGGSPPPVHTADTSYTCDPSTGAAEIMLTYGTLTQTASTDYTWIMTLTRP